MRLHRARPGSASEPRASDLAERSPLVAVAAVKPLVGSLVDAARAGRRMALTVGDEAQRHSAIARHRQFEDNRVWTLGGGPIVQRDVQPSSDFCSVGIALPVMTIPIDPMFGTSVRTFRIEPLAEPVPPPSGCAATADAKPNDHSRRGRKHTPTKEVST